MYVSEWIKMLFGYINVDSYNTLDAVKNAMAALNALLKSIPKDKTQDYLTSIRKGITSAYEDLQVSDANSSSLHGFDLPKSISTLVSIMIHNM